MRKIKLTQGEHAMTSNRDYIRVSKYNWYCSKKKDVYTKYAGRIMFRKGKRIQTSTHRFIMNPPNDMQVDHINGNGLDNRRSNLRICTVRENTCNRRVTSKNSTTGYKGVRVYRKTAYYAVITYQGKELWLGIFKDPKDAARTYDLYAKKIQGKFARLNFPNPELKINK